MLYLDYFYSFTLQSDSSVRGGAEAMILYLSNLPYSIGRVVILPNSVAGLSAALIAYLLLCDFRNIHKQVYKEQHEEIYHHQVTWENVLSLGTLLGSYRLSYPTKKVDLPFN